MLIRQCQRAECGEYSRHNRTEGGFSREEAERITGSGGKSVSLGKTILRTETASLAALSMIIYEMEL